MLFKPSLRTAFSSLKISYIFGVSFSIGEKRNLIWEALRITYCFVLIAINIYIMIGADAINFETETNFLQLLKIFTATLTSIFNILLIVFSYKNSKNMVKTFQNYLKLEDACRKYGMEISYRKLFFYVNGSITLIILFDVIQFTAFANSYLSSNKYIFVKSFIFNGFYLVFLQMSAYVCLLNQYLGLIGKELENIEYFKSFTTDFLRCCPWKIREEKLRFIMHTHRKLFDVSRGINSIFSSAILFCVTNSFVTIFTLLFFTWHRFFEEPVTYSRNVCFDYIFMIVSILQYSIPLFVLCWFCERTIVENENIRSAVRELAGNKRNTLLNKKVIFHL